MSTVTLAEPTSDVPGSLFRVHVDEDSPLERGVGDEAYAFYQYDWVMRASARSHVAVAFPPADSDDRFVSGFAQNAEELGGTAAVVDEPRGEGRSTVLSVEPNFRAFTTGFQKILRNALLSDPGRRPASAGRAHGAAALRRALSGAALARQVAFLIANPRGLSGHDHPFATRLPAALERAGVATLAFRAP